MLGAYRPEAEDVRRISLLYERSGIEHRYSVLPDFTPANGLQALFEVNKAVPSLESRMELYNEKAVQLSIDAIRDCLDGHVDAGEITCLITISCTGMSAPGLDIGIMQEMGLCSSIQRSSVNFMGCYAALHGLKMADSICRADPDAKVLIVCTELCTLHFQNDAEMDSVTSALLFGDGSAATLVTGDGYSEKGLHISSFYSEVALQGKKDMAWHLSGNGFLMRLSAYIPQLLQMGIVSLLDKALERGHHERNSITQWAFHPGGRKILETISKELQLQKEDLRASYDVLRDYGNMSSPTILFVLKTIMKRAGRDGEKIFAAAFGPGLTMETVILEQ